MVQGLTDLIYSIVFNIIQDELIEEGNWLCHCDVTHLHWPKPLKAKTDTTTRTTLGLLLDAHSLSSIQLSVLQDILWLKQAVDKMPEDVSLVCEKGEMKQPFFLGICVGIRHVWLNHSGVRSCNCVMWESCRDSWQMHGTKVVGRRFQIQDELYCPTSGKFALDF